MEDKASRTNTFRKAYQSSSTLWTWISHKRAANMDAGIEGRTPRIIGRSCRAYTETWYIQNIVLQVYRVLSTGAVLWQSYTAETTGGRCYVTLDVSIDRRTPQIAFTGYASNIRRKRDSSTLECTERSRSFQGQLRARQESLPVLA